MNNLIVKENKENNELSVDSVSLSGVDPYMRLIETAVSNDCDLQKLEKLMDLQERYEANLAKKAFNAAMSKFQSIVPVVEKKGNVNYQSKGQITNYDYAKLEDIAKAIQPSLDETGLSYRFSQDQSGSSNYIKVFCTITHTQGHSEKSEMVSPPDISGGKSQIKAMASTISYLKRYLLIGAFGITVGGEDDDACSAALESKSTPITIDEAENIKLILEKKGKDEAFFIDWASRVFKREIKSVDELKKEEYLHFERMMNKGAK